MSPVAEVKGHKRGLSENVPLPPPIASRPVEPVPEETLPAVAALQINYESDAPRMLQQEAKPYLWNKTLYEIRHSPRVQEVVATGFVSPFFSWSIAL